MKNIAKNTISLYGLSIAKIVFPMITLPYLTRVLSVDTYGVVSYVKALVQYMQIIVDFGFMLSGTKEIVSCRDSIDECSRTVSEITFARMLLAGGAVALAIVLSFFIPILQQNKLFLFLSLIPSILTIFLFDFFFRGIEKMSVITRQFVIMKGISVILTFVFVRSDADIMWIPILDIAGSVAAILFVIHMIKAEGIKLRKSSFSAAFAQIKTAFVFFMSNMVSTVFNVLITIIIGIVLSEADISYWSLCVQIIAAVQILYNPIADGIYPEMIKKFDLNTVKRTFMIFLPIVLIGCITAYFMADYGILIVAGSKYLPETAKLFRMLIPVLLFSFPSLILGWPVLGALKKERFVTGTVALSASFQIVCIVVLMVLGKLDLYSIAVVRCLTEFVLFLARLIGFFKAIPHN